MPYTKSNKKLALYIKVIIELLGAEILLKIYN
jgi:hypothetical protein